MKEIIIAVVGSGVLSAVISGVFGLIKDRKTRENGTTKGVRIILYDRIKFLAGKYIAAEEISQEQLEDLTVMHNIYHSDLGGNGFLDDYMARAKALPLVKVKK